jgi:hypothetical protein
MLDLAPQILNLSYVCFTDSLHFPLLSFLPNLVHATEEVVQDVLRRVREPGSEETEPTIKRQNRSYYDLIDT